MLTTIRQIPARDAKFRPMPTWVTSALAGTYLAKGIRELYSHQASSAELVRNGKTVVVVTPTASGKTLCYNLPILNAVQENPDARALYLFPTKALAQDQLAELRDLAKRLDDSFGVFTYDGDTPSDARKAIRERGHIVLTNPDMLHTGILPHQPNGCDCSRTCAISCSMSCTTARTKCNHGIALLAHRLDGYLLRSSSATLPSTVWSWDALYSATARQYIASGAKVESAY